MLHINKTYGNPQFYCYFTLAIAVTVKLQIISKVLELSVRQTGNYLGSKEPTILPHSLN